MKTQIKKLNFKESGLNKEEWNFLKSLSNPRKIQDFLNSLPFNFEKNGQTHSSVRYSLKRGTIHCFEGSLIAAAALWIQGKRPLLLDLVTIPHDLDHVVTLFEEGGFWGAVSKTNHSVLRYRDPVYKNVRELTMSYFHEYFLPSGNKTLRKFSKPFDLSRVGTDWLTTTENLATIAHVLDSSPHENILTPKQIKMLRKAEKLERKASEITEWKS